jgi:excinuclease UvrABC nuclease subunit
MSKNLNPSQLESPLPSFDNFTPPFKLPLYPDLPGVYVVLDEKEQILYIGSAKQLCRRSSQLTAVLKTAHIKGSLIREHQSNGHDVYVRFYPCINYKMLEKKLIKEHTPLWNITHNRSKRQI